MHLKKNWLNLNKFCRFVPMAMYFLISSGSYIRCHHLRKLVKRTGQGNGTPLQYSCLENSMDGGAWWAAIHGVARSRTRLKRLSSSSSSISEENICAAFQLLVRLWLFLNENIFWHLRNELTKIESPKYIFKCECFPSESWEKHLCHNSAWWG